MKLFFLPLISAFFLFSCSGDSEDDLKETPSTTGQEVNLIFEKDVKPLIADRCLKCHGSPTMFGAPASAVYVTFDQVSANANAMLARMSNGSMPPASEGMLSASFVETFNKWIDDGKLEE
ncbi:hypothetical protein [Aquimarina agarivorans]|uniref:hypothetical protein n=1 Tax=Aquimarina agarivorans TaxID=980584 RepID=UPI000248FB39|nr:hypothetical protein [Aquimarina agarivorans]